MLQPMWHLQVRPLAGGCWRRHYSPQRSGSTHKHAHTHSHNTHKHTPNAVSVRYLYLSLAVSLYLSLSPLFLFSLPSLSLLSLLTLHQLSPVRSSTAIVPPAPLLFITIVTLCFSCPSHTSLSAAPSPILLLFSPR